MLELKLNGKNITSHEYLENVLKLIPGTGRQGREDLGGQAEEGCHLLPSSVESFIFPIGWKSAEVLIGHWLIMSGTWCLISSGRSRT